MPNTKPTKTHNVVHEASKEASSKHHVANIQNNFNFAQTIDLDKLAYLSSTDKALAERVMCLYETQLAHVKEMDKGLLGLEEEEQKLRKVDVPYQRRFAFRALGSAWSVSVLGLCTCAYALYLGSPWVASVAISIPAGVVAVNMLGIRNRHQK